MAFATHIYFFNFSALQYPHAVQQHLDKEIDHEAKIGQVDTSFHFHCSLLSKRSKDSNKCRVILDVSYPCSNSLNDKVNKCQFDGIRFVLRFSSVDDIVAKILDTPSDLYLTKIEPAR